MDSSKAFLGVVALIFCSILFAQDPPAAWSPTAALAEARYHSCAVRLTDGRILVSGGTGVAGDLSSAEIYLPEGSFIPAPRLNSTHSQHSCTLLNDGRVLVAGGDAEGTGSAELFDPAAGTWQVVAGTGQARSGHTATLLTDGRVLLAGGAAGEIQLNSVEIFDPLQNSLTRLDAVLSDARDQHASVILLDGRILIVGGRGAAGPLASTEIFDPGDSSIQPGPALATARAGHSATRLDDGRVIVAGGSDGQKETDTAEWLDPDQMVWQPLDARLHTARRDHLAILVPGNGGILIAGGLQQDQALAATELFLPVENTFLALGSLTAARTGLAVAAVDAGMVLAAGGINGAGVQSACGVILLPAIQFTKSLYHPGEFALAGGSFFPPSTTVNFSLSFLSGSIRDADERGRLISSSATTPASRGNIPIGFSAVVIFATQSTDAGKSAQLVAQTAGGITATATVPVKVATTLTFATPTVVFEGFDVTFLAQLTRTSSPFPMTGTIKVSASNGSSSSITDGTSNTILIGEALATATGTVSTTGTSVFQQLHESGVPAAPLSVTAQYSGDAVNEASSATIPYMAVSKTPVVHFSTSTNAPQAGLTFALTATAQAAGIALPAQNPTGTFSFFQSGFLLGTVTGRLVAGTNPPLLSASLPITPLTLSPISVNASYSGDSFFRPVTALGVTFTIAKAATTLAFVNPPPTYQCGQPSTFTTVLTFPAALGLSTRTVTLQAQNLDGSVRAVNAPQATLTPDPVNLGTASATFTGTLPLDTLSVTANFPGDALFAAAASQPIHPALALSPVTAELVGLPPTVTGAVNLVARITGSSCSGFPSGTVEFLDGTASLGVLQVPSGTQTLPAVGAPPAATSTLSQVSRPAGLHNLQVKYSGDRHYSPATSAVVPVVFQ